MNCDVRPSRKPEGFSKAERLQRRRQFDHAIQDGVTAACRVMRMWGALNDVGYPRLGLIVSKKHGNAVRRNRLKRLAREAFRRNKAGFSCAIDLVVLYRDSRGVGYAEVEEALRDLVAKLRERLGM